MSKTGLGKGIDELIPSDFDKSFLLDKNERVQKLAIDQIIPSKDQPRRFFDESEIDDLANSIKQYGVLQPLIVMEAGGSKFAIIAGERRWRAAKKVGLKTVPAIVRTAKKVEQLEIALIENVQRVNLSPLEQALTIERLHEQFSLEYADIAKKLGKAQTTVTNIVRLLNLPREAKLALKDNKITEGHARSILALKDASKQRSLLENIIKKGWSVRQAEQYVSGAKKGKQTKESLENYMVNETPETNQLGHHLKTRVTIKRTAHGGRLEIDFKSDKQLADIIEILNAKFKRP